ncbi:MAG: DUF445 domain-containing protein [Burkholderiales bacterium]|nr:DUF445 domain-containing protein [Burkholderiales bacterium]
MEDPHNEIKRTKLRGMQRLATSLLVLMLALLVLSVVFRDAHPSMQWLQAFAAAAAVGAIADWFAVVALFHHPLGLPLPHTAIVPRNKERIGASLGHFVEHNFLTAENVMRKLGARNLGLVVADWAAKRENADDLAARVCALIPGMLDAFDDADVKRLFDRALVSQLSKIDLAAVTSTLLTVLTAGGRHQALLDRALRALEAWLLINQAAITRKFGDASKYTPRVFDRYVVAKFVAGIVALMHEIAADPGHEIRRQFDRATQEFIDKLDTSPEYREHAEGFKRELLAHLEQENYYQLVWRDVEARLRADLAAGHSVIRGHIAEILLKLASGLREDRALQEKLNAWLMHVAEAAVVRHRHQVSSLITEVVKGWDTRELTQKMELEIGKDLQYIRINGTLVGGLVGLVLHTIT